MVVPANLPPVLVVDDDDDEMHLIKRALLKSGIRNPVVSFDNAAKATAFLASLASAPNAVLPCVVFTDLKMPAMDGFELVQWIRKQKSLANVMVIVLSNSGLEKDRRRAKDAGVDDYLVKLPTPDQLAGLIEEACARSRKYPEGRSPR